MFSQLPTRLLVLLFVITFGACQKQHDTSPAEEVAAAWLGRAPQGANRGTTNAAKHRSGTTSKTIDSPCGFSAIDGEIIGSDVWQHHTRQRAAHVAARTKEIDHEETHRRSL